MTVDDFLRWHQNRPETEHYELVRGEPVAMAPERSEHARIKARVWARLDEAIAALGLPCEAFPDGMTVRIDDTTAYEPDAVVQCGPPVPKDGLEVPTPLIVVEVRSPTSARRDAGLKLADYFRAPSLRHYLIVGTDAPLVIHHRRGEDGTITVEPHHTGPLRLDPPGITLEIDRFYRR